MRMLCSDVKITPLTMLMGLLRIAWLTFADQCASFKRQPIRMLKSQLCNSATQLTCR